MKMVENSDVGEGRRPQEFGPWREVFSSSGKIYFYNSETEVSQWDKPQEWREHEAKQEVQRLAAFEAERQRHQAVSSQSMPQFPYSFPNMPNIPVLPPNLPPPPSFPYANSGLPFSIPAPPGFPPAPPPIPPPRVQLPPAPQRLPPNKNTDPPQMLSPSTSKQFAQWLTRQIQSNIPLQPPLPPPWLVEPQLISPPKLSFNPMQMQQHMQQQQMQQQQMQQQQVHQQQQRLNLPRTMQSYSGAVGQPPRYPGQDMLRPIQREEQKPPHPYAIPQALPPRDAPHPYRRDDPIRKSLEIRTEAEVSRKREAENVAADNEPKRPARTTEEISQDGQQPESTEDNPSEEEEPFMKHIDSEAQARADELKAELNLNVDQHAFNVRIDSYAANRKAQESNNKALANRTYDIILSHEIQLLDIQIRGIEERRQKVENYPLRPPVFDTVENRSKWIHSLLENMRERQKRNDDFGAELQRKLDESLDIIDAEMAEASVKLEEDKAIRREAATQRQQQTETERVKSYLEVANKMEETVKKLNRKQEDGKRRIANE